MRIHTQNASERGCGDASRECIVSCHYDFCCGLVGGKRRDGVVGVCRPCSCAMFQSVCRSDARFSLVVVSDSIGISRRGCVERRGGLFEVLFGSLWGFRNPFGWSRGWRGAPFSLPVLSTACASKQPNNAYLHYLPMGWGLILNPRSTASTNPASDIPPSLPHLTSHQNCPPARCVCLSVSLSQPRCLSQSPPSVPSQPKLIPPEHTPHLVPYEPPIHSLCQSFFFGGGGSFYRPTMDTAAAKWELTAANTASHRIVGDSPPFLPLWRV